MMAPSLSNSKSSPSFYKDEINNENVENENQQDNQIGELGEGGDLGDLSELLIPSLNIPHLLDGLNEIEGQPNFHCLSSSNNSSASGSSANSNNNNNNSFLKGSGSAPRSLGYQIFRTFPYRGSLPQPLQQIINALGDGSAINATTTKSEDDGSGSSGGGGSNNNSNQEKKKPCSTNGLRHSRQYKALFQDSNGNKDEDIKKFTTSINLSSITNPQTQQPNQQPQQQQQQQHQQIPTINIENLNSQELGESSGVSSSDVIVSQDQPSFLDSSFFQPPVSPRLLQLEKELQEGKSVEENDENDEIKNLKEQLAFETKDLESISAADSPATSSTQWSQLIESLDQPNELKQSIGDLNDLKNLSLDGISLEFGNSPMKSSTNSALEEQQEQDQKDLNQTLELQPPSFTSSPPTSTASPSTSPNTSSNFLTATPSMLSPPKRKETNAGNSATVTPFFIDSKTNAYRVKGQLESSGDTNLKKKQQLARTITFSDPTSIHSFFGSSSDSVPETTTTTSSGGITASTNPKTAHRQLTSIFPKLNINQSSATPAKFYYPLSQPQPSSLIREFATKADVNTKGLKRAKKPCLDMEDEYLAMYPFGDDPQMALFAIFDGHSGKNVAVKAKEILPNILLKYIQSAKNECGKQIYDMSAVFSATFKETDAQLSKFEYEGSTATIVLIWRVGQQRFLQSANVGDSSAFLSYAGETLVLTKDHRVTDPDEQQRIKDDGVQLGENQTRINGLMVSRALGDHFIKHLNCGLSGEPFVSPPISLTPFHSHLIVASDGLWDVISGNRAMEMIKMEQSAEKMASMLLQCSLVSKKSKDNISIIVSTL